jgi:hypothetical protein
MSPVSDRPPVPPGVLPGGAAPAEYPSTPPLAPPLPPVPPGAVRPGSPWAPPPAPPAPPGGGGRRVWVVLAAIAVVVALVAATAAALGGGDDSEEATADREPRQRDEAPATTDATDTTETTAPPAVDDLATVVNDIQTFVEQKRGLPFLRDVEVELVPDAEFEAGLLEDFDEDVPEIEIHGRLLEAIGLVEPGFDIVEAYRTLLGAGVVGFYDTETDDLVVRGGSTTPYVRTVIAHELTHALDDQHFELHRPDLEDADDESAFGFSALVEGNARRVEDAYRATFTPDEEAEAAAEELTIGADVDLFAIPVVLFDQLLAPYVLGPDLVDAILAAGDQAQLDAAFGAPPSTSEHLLDPGSFLDGDVAVAVDPPVPDDGAAALDEGVLGALGLEELLGGTPSLLPELPIDPAAEGWGGDRYVVWEDLDGSGSCARIVFLGDDPDDTAEIASALFAWAESAPFGVSAVVSEGNSGVGPVTLTSCSA